MKRSRCLALLIVFTVVISSTAVFLSSSCGSLPKGAYKNGAVVSRHAIASQVGVDIMKKGGNAVDAAVAVSYALAVVFPQAGNIGGGGFMVLRTPDGTATSIDYREKAPGKAHRDMYLDENGEVITQLTRTGALASGVPGTVAGTLYVLEKYGTMSREEVIQPAIDLAENGYILTFPMGGDRFKQFPSSNAIFNKPDGSRYEEGELWVQKDLAKSLRLIAEKGRDGFYKGETADCIVNTMKKYGGIISYEDLENYQPVERAPITGTYRDYGIVSMPPPSSGGICLVSMLNILERYDIGASGWNTPETVHLMTEAMRRVYADRNYYIADPDFIDVPVDGLISKEYADIRARDIDPGRATPSMDVMHGDVRIVAGESDETTHYSVVDKDGMAVSVTTTLEAMFGSFLVVEGAGFLLNNEMGDFSAKSGVPNTSGLVYGDANSIEPDKRMLSSMTPSIVTRDGKNYIVVGAAGGPRIITMVLQSVMNVIDHGMDAHAAFGAPGFHHQWLPDKLGHRKAFSEETINQLKALGHTIEGRGLNSAHGIIIDPESGLLLTAMKSAAGY